MIHGAKLTKRQDQILKKIAPKWREHIRASGDPDLVMDYFEYDLSMADSCLVGEAYGFTNDYTYKYDFSETGRNKNYCDECCIFGDMFLDSWQTYDFDTPLTLKTNRHSAIDTWATLLPKFLDHFAKHHKERIPK